MTNSKRVKFIGTVEDLAEWGINTEESQKEIIGKILKLTGEVKIRGNEYFLVVKYPGNDYTTWTVPKRLLTDKFDEL